jgi:hypothetical protein
VRRLVYGFLGPQAFDRLGALVRVEEERPSAQLEVPMVELARSPQGPERLIRHPVVTLVVV